MFAWVWGLLLVRFDCFVLVLFTLWLCFVWFIDDLNVWLDMFGLFGGLFAISVLGLSFGGLRWLFRSVMVLLSSSLLY